jgi:hypothetical protein
MIFIKMMILNDLIYKTSTKDSYTREKHYFYTLQTKML